MNKQVWVSVHDYLGAQIAVEAGVDALLVGDSLGMTVYGYASTRQVTLETMLRHAEAVRRGAGDSALPIVADLPFGTYQNAKAALKSAAAFAEVGITTLKLEGGTAILPQVEALIANGYQVVGHLGVLPQTAETYRVVGKTEAEVEQLLRDAQALEQAGIETLVLECVPAVVGAQVADRLAIPVIGIGAGADVDGQVLVYADIIGRMPAGFRPRFVRCFGEAHQREGSALADYLQAVRSGRFPGAGERYD